MIAKTSLRVANASAVPKLSRNPTLEAALRLDPHVARQDGVRSGDPVPQRLPHAIASCRAAANFRVARFLHQMYTPVTESIATTRPSMLTNT